MGFLKFCGGLVVVISGTLCGIYASKSLEKKVRFLEQYIMFLTQAKTMINYSAVSVTQILSSANSIPLVEPMLKRCLEGLSNGNNLSSAWHNAVDFSYCNRLCTKEERTMLYSFGDTFGSSNIEGEITKTELHIELANDRLEKLKQEFASKCKLYRIVGMFSGIMITLVIY